MDNIPQLFLGFPVDPIYERELLKANPSLLDQFTNGQYLEKITYGGMQYLGVFLSQSAKISEITLKEPFIYSILSRLVAKYPYDETQLMLFVI